MGGTLGTILFIVVMFGFMYFFMIRPQRKQQSQHQQMVNNLNKGDSVVTIGRLHGIIDSVDKENRTVTLDCDGIFLVFDLSAVAKATPAAQATATPSVESDASAAPAVADSAASSEADSAASVTDSAADSVESQE